MRTKFEDEITYKIVTQAETETTDEESIKISIKKFYGGSPKGWLKWSIKFIELCQLKQWNAVQVYTNLLILLGDDVKAEFKDLVNGQNLANYTVEQVYNALSSSIIIPNDFRDTLEDELFAMKKSKADTVLKFSLKYKEHLRYFPALPVNNEPISGRQQIHFFIKSLSPTWQ